MRFILLTIADAANADGDHAHPGLSAIADGSLYSRSRVTEVLRRLVDDGWIEVEEDGGGRGKATVYRIPGVNDPAWKPAGEWQVSDAKPSTSDGETCHFQDVNGPVSADRALCLNIELPTVKTNDVRAREEHVVFDAWVESTGKTRAALDSKRRRLIRARLDDGYTVDDLRLAVTGWQFSPHHRGENERGTVYNDLGLILRDADHVDAFRGYAETRSGGGRVTSGRDPLAGVREFLADRAETHSFAGEVGRG